MSSIARVACIRRAYIPRVQHRQLSSDSNGHPHDEHHDSTAYPSEGFSLAFWRNTLVFSAIVVGFYKFAPAPDQDVYLTRWIARITPPREVWKNLNVKHLLQAQQLSEETLLISNAKRPTVHRYRYPQSLDQASSHLIPVGRATDLRQLVVKGDGQ